MNFDNQLETFWDERPLWQKILIIITIIGCCIFCLFIGVYIGRKTYNYEPVTITPLSEIPSSRSSYGTREYITNSLSNPLSLSGQKQMPQWYGNKTPTYPTSMSLPEYMPSKGTLPITQQYGRMPTLDNLEYDTVSDNREPYYDPYKTTIINY